MVPGASQGFDPDAQIGMSPARSALQNVAFTQQRRQVTGVGSKAERHGGYDHVGQSWMDCDVGESATMGGERALRIERSELPQQSTSLGEGAYRRRVEPGQFACFNHTPFREIQRQRRKVRLQDFRRAAREECLLLGRRPEAITGAWLQAARASASSPV
jgi:hypothetical protein